LSDVPAFNRDIYRTADRISGGRVKVLRKAIVGFSETRAAQAAAAMAYYAVFSLFPLLLVLVAVTGFLVTDERAHGEVVRVVTAAIPVSQDLVEGNVQRVLELRGPVGIVGLVGLLWSASGVFMVLAHNINSAWPNADPRSTLERRLLGMAMAGVLLVLLLLSLTSSTVLGLLPRLQVPLAGGISIYETALWGVFSRVMPWLFTLLLFLALYRWVPNTGVKWKAAGLGAALAAIAWEISKNLFAWYVGSGFVSYQLVYGSLGTVVALMLWIYLSGWIALFGAHLTSAIGAALKAGDREA
jgi:membrane protein